jgi:hypothetical protein
VVCSSGGEIKKVEGGWECDIPAKTKPADGKMQAYATVESTFLTGRIELELKDDYNPMATITLARDKSATIKGIVVDEHNMPLAGARVVVVGYETEAQITQQGGNFSLPAHAAKDQQVHLYVLKEGYDAGPPQWHAAGDFPVTITLFPVRSSSHKL